MGTSVANIIREAKRLKGFNQRDLAKFLGKSQPQVSKYLNGQSMPPADVYIRCMNIINELTREPTIAAETHKQLKEAVRLLKGEENMEFCQALLSMINAYRNQN